MENNKLNMVLPILIGSIVGATIGVLFAPASGKTTRKKIKTKTLEAAHDLSDQIVHAKDEITKFASDKKIELEKKMESKISNLSYKTEGLINKLEDKLEDLKKKNAVLH